MRALIWIREETWERCVDGAARLLPADADVTLLHVAPAEIEEVVEGAVAGLLGRGRQRPPEPRQDHPALREISHEAALDLLAAAATRLGRLAATESRRGRIEDEVLAAATVADVLVCARDSDAPGPRSLAPPTRFVVDHAAAGVLLV